MTSLVDLLALAHDAVDLARDLIRNTGPGRLTMKGERDFTSEVDFAVERALRQMLNDRTPNIGFLGEGEGASDQSSDCTWVLDPLDGTVNFVHGHPLVAVSLGLLRNQTPVLGVIDAPFLQERYAAVQGHGATGPHGRLSPSQTVHLHEAIVSIGDYAVGEAAAAKNALRLSVTTRLAAHAQRVRMHGSAAIDLAWVAAGRTDAAVIMANTPWDMTAGVAIAREAGVLVLDRDGTAHTMASNATIAVGPALRDPLLNLIDA